MKTDKDDLVKFLTALALIFGGLGIVDLGRRAQHLRAVP
mgnify:CR=1 FL=1